MKTIDVEPQENAENQERAVAIRQPSLLPEAMQKAASPALTPQQARVSEVTDALAPAYQKASTLEMTDEEIAAVMAPFPDSFVAIRPHDGLIYIPHIHISDRFNQVFKPGKWALVCRRHWMEGGTMYGEYVLLIRGCYVGESVGGHPYIANNPKTNYSDALESTAAEALRRIAGKRLSCGSQVWNPDYAANWVNQYAEQKNGKWYKKAHAHTQAAKPATPALAPPPAPAPKPAAEAAPRVATDATRTWMIEMLGRNSSLTLDTATEYFVQVGALLPTEKIEDLPLSHVPTSHGEMQAIVKAVLAFIQTGEAKPAFAPHKEAPLTNEKPIEVPRDTNPPADIADQPWAKVIVPIPHKGEKRDEYLKHPDTIGSLYAAASSDEEAARRLFGFVNHFEPKPWTNREGKEMPPNKTDVAFREALDAFAAWHEKHESEPDAKVRDGNPADYGD